MSEKHTYCHVCGRKMVLVEAPHTIKVNGAAVESWTKRCPEQCDELIFMDGNFPEPIKLIDDMPACPACIIGTDRVEGAIQGCLACYDYLLSLAEDE